MCLQYRDGYMTMKYYHCSAEESHVSPLECKTNTKNHMYIHRSICTLPHYVGEIWTRRCISKGNPTLHTNPSRAFRDRSSNLRILKTLAFKRFENGAFCYDKYRIPLISLIVFHQKISLKWPVFVVFLNNSGVRSVMEIKTCNGFSEWNLRFQIPRV